MATASSQLIPEFKDGFTVLPAGMHGGLRPVLVPAGRVSRAINISFRGGYATTRPGWTPCVDLKTQGAGPYQGGGRWRAGSSEYIVSVFNGGVYCYDLVSGAVNVIPGAMTPGSQVFTTQAGGLFVMGDGQHSVALEVVDNVPTKVYPAATADPTKMVPGTIMHYCQGRIHYVPTALGISPTSNLSYSRYFLSGDILLPGDSMTALGTSEISTLDGGLARGLPDELGPIRGMISAQNPGKGLGMGPLYVFARDGVAAFDVSIPRSSVVAADGTVLQPGWVGSPLGSVLEYGTGTESPWSLTAEGTDVCFRGRDGIYSLSRDKQSAQSGAIAPTPISFEVQRWIDPETNLSAISGATSDRRLHVTAISDGADGYLGMLTLDSAISTSMGVDAAPAWDGIWTGPRYARILTASRLGQETLFAVLTDGSIFRLDDTSDTDGGTAITSQIITKAMYSDQTLIVSYKRLKYIDLWLQDITRDTTVQVYFRPDGYPLWTPVGCQKTFSVDPANSLPQERRRTRFSCRDVGPENDPKPGMNSGSLRCGYTFQIKLVFTGCAAVTRLDCVADAIAEENPLQENADSSSQKFSITPSQFHTADVDFIQLPPGPGLDEGFVRGPTAIGSTGWDQGVGVPSSAWPPAYTRQVFPAGPQGPPGATIIINQSGRKTNPTDPTDPLDPGGSGRVCGDADRPSLKHRSIITDSIDKGTQVLKLFGVDAQANDFAIGDTILAVDKDGSTGRKYIPIAPSDLQSGDRIVALSAEGVLTAKGVASPAAVFSAYDKIMALDNHNNIGSREIDLTPGPFVLNDKIAAFTEAGALGTRGVASPTSILGNDDTLVVFDHAGNLGSRVVTRSATELVWGDTLLAIGASGHIGTRPVNQAAVAFDLRTDKILTIDAGDAIVTRNVDTTSIDPFHPTTEKVLTVDAGGAIVTRTIDAANPTPFSVGDKILVVDEGDDVVTRSIDPTPAVLAAGDSLAAFDIKGNMTSKILVDSSDGLVTGDNLVVRALDKSLATRGFPTGNQYKVLQIDGSGGIIADWVRFSA